MSNMPLQEQPPTLDVGDKRIPVKRFELLNQLRLAVSRLELDEPRHGLPKIFIVKQQKHNGEAEFCNEISTYEGLQGLQGTVIPILFSQGLLNGCPALILLEAEGMTLRDLAKLDESAVPEQTIESGLQQAFRELHRNGAIHCDPNLGNFLLCKNGKIVVIDLEEVNFSPRQQSWELSANLGNVEYLMSRFRDVRYPNRPPSPISYWEGHSAINNDGIGSDALSLPFMTGLENVV
ncbi:hypothetical protein N7493_002254 [Penicillium malachiteum]|uniref:ABC1 atypical kinase-like domain-containing protein n=1 Tax=Penicillium malachiteum TaxID=1324776 RepID=A0AAD6MYF6_9EURO|nr:hypothetical protein N7493_002254 [Penicillium malachiteum]